MIECRAILVDLVKENKMMTEIAVGVKTGGWLNSNAVCGDYEDYQDSNVAPSDKLTDLVTDAAALDAKMIF